MKHIRAESLGRLLLLSTMGVGAALPLGEGCGGPCPELEPEPVYRILDDRPDWVAGSGTIRTTDEAFVISYDTKDGSRWEVEYRRIPHLGP